MDELISRDRKFFAMILGAIFFVIFLWFIAPPFSFPSKSIITVTNGVGLYELAEELKQDGVIHSSFWFRFSAIILGGEHDMKAGQYYMSNPQNVFFIAWRILHGNYDIDTVRLTIPEGFTVKEISELFDSRFTFFNHKDFMDSASEGYLFPDTYFIPVNATASSTTKLLQDNFDRKILPITQEIKLSGRTLKEIIIMASIIEGETKLQEDREIVSSILWKRLDLGIPLQVDASFVYVNGKTTEELTKDDLKIDSPFNTYLYKGLPPTPISNPGIESIRAAIHPTNTPYLYFLTGDDGTMHYSKTFEEHVAKKLKYIKN